MISTAEIVLRLREGPRADNGAYDILSLNYPDDFRANWGLMDGDTTVMSGAGDCAGDCAGNGNSGDSCGQGAGNGGALRNDDHRCPSAHHDETVAVKLSGVCSASSFAVFGADRTVAETDLRHVRVSYSLDGTSWTCYTQSDDATQGGTPSMATASDNCDEGPSHGASGSVYNIAAPAQYVSFAFWGWTDVYEIQLKSCDVAGDAFAIGCSALTCAGLNEAYGEWPIDNTCTELDSVDVCAESDAGFGQYSLVDNTRAKACLGGITDTDQGDDEATDGWNHASTICTSMGARLCSVAELQADETRCTGCQVPIVACTLILTVNWYCY